MKYKIAFLAVLAILLFQHFQISELEGELSSKNVEIALLGSDYEELEAALEQAKQKLEHVNRTLGESTAMLETAQADTEALNFSKSVSAHILGITGGVGIVVPLEIELKEGTGRVFVDVGEIFIDEEVQSAAKTAFALADVKTKGNLSDKDVSIHIVNPYSKPITITGLSSGAILTVSLMALGKDKTIKDGIMITGTVDGRGNIGQVTHIKEKAVAAKEANATVMLVPRGQKISVAGIEIIEVSNVEEAAEYMLK